MNKTKKEIIWRMTRIGCISGVDTAVVKNVDYLVRLKIPSSCFWQPSRFVRDSIEESIPRNFSDK